MPTKPASKSIAPLVATGPTVRDPLAAAEAAAAAAIVESAQRWLAQFVPLAKARSGLYRRMAAEAAPILARAGAIPVPRLRALGCRLTDVMDQHERECAEVNGWTESATAVQSEVDRIGRLTVKECRLPPGFDSLGRQAPAVERIRDLMLGQCGSGEDRLRDHLSNLSETTATLERWIRNYAANPPAPPVTAMKPQEPPAEPSGPGWINPFARG